VIRTSPADGASVAALRITPRNADGSLRVAARVEIAIVNGSAATIAPPIDDGNGWLGGVFAPAAPGSSVIEVRIDGVPSPIRPRIWWN
jgi:hypothetical protein